MSHELLFAEQEFCIAQVSLSVGDIDA